MSSAPVCTYPAKFVCRGNSSKIKLLRWTKTLVVNDQLCGVFQRADSPDLDVCVRAGSIFDNFKPSSLLSFAS